MRKMKMFYLSFALLLFCAMAQAGDVRILKVLPHFIDNQGRHTIRPTLADRDAYQAYLRDKPNLRSAIRFDLQWRAKQTDNANLKLKLELRGTGGKTIPTKTIEQNLIASGSRQWTAIQFEGEEYKKFGEVVAWRVTLWENGKQAAEQKSFLW